MFMYKPREHNIQKPNIVALKSEYHPKLSELKKLNTIN